MNNYVFCYNVKTEDNIKIYYQIQGILLAQTKPLILPVYGRHILLSDYFYTGLYIILLLKIIIKFSPVIMYPIFL